MSRNVILTTMSTLPKERRKSPSYYYDGISRFCEGIASTEAGSKFILSTADDIDEIIVIGSEETYYPGNGRTSGDGNTPDAISRMNVLQYYQEHEEEDLSNVSPYAFFRHRIGRYCSCADAWEERMWDDISEERQTELRELTRVFMEERGFTDSTEWFSILANEAMKDSDSKGLKGELHRELKKKVTSSSGAVGKSGNGNEFSYVKAYLFSLMPDSMKIIPDRDISGVCITFIPERVRTEDGTEIDNVDDILSAIKGEGDETVNLYVDVQGGGRTDGYVRNAILAILAAERGGKFNLCRMLAVNFETRYFASEIVDESERYRITDLVAGMNAFTQFGKAKAIKDYCDAIYPDEEHIKNLVNEMWKIDMALSTCSIDEFTKALKDAHALFGTNANDPVFALMESEIKKEYEGILNSDGTIDYVNMCKWAKDKGFIQQALTIIEAKFPAEIVRNGICYYDMERAKDYFISMTQNLKVAQYQFRDLTNIYIKDMSLGKNSKKAGKKTYANKKAMKAVLKDYKRVFKRRNQINHSNTGGEPIETFFPSTITILTDFLDNYEKAYDQAKSNTSRKEIHIFTQDELGITELLENRHKGDTAGKAKEKTAPIKREYKSELPKDKNLQYNAMILGNLKGKQATGVKGETGFEYVAENYYPTRKKDFDKINEYYRSPQGKEDSEAFIQSVVNDVAEFKSGLENTVLFVNEDFYQLCDKETFARITEGTSGVVFLGRDSNKGWHIIEKL